MRPCSLCLCLCLLAPTACLAAGQVPDPFAVSSFVPGPRADALEEFLPEAPRWSTNGADYRWLGPVTRIRQSRPGWWGALLPQLSVRVQGPRSEGSLRLGLNYSSQERIEPGRLIVFGRLGVLRFRTPVNDCTMETGCRLDLGVRSAGAPKLHGRLYFGLYYAF